MGVGKVEVSQEHSCWTADYLLGHCEDYRVESKEGRLGSVEEVVWSPDGSEPLAFRVGTGYQGEGLVTIAMEDVIELHPDGEWILVRAPRAVPAPLTRRP
jgi:hypothetical protein